MVSESNKERGETRSYWRCRKKDFFPEPSFRSWSTYIAALAATVPRLRERAFHRSLDTDELDVLRRRSESELRRCLTWWDLAWLGFGAVVGTGIFVLTGLEARNDSGPSIVVSYAAAGLSALLSVFCYTEFAVEIPSAGGSFSYLRVELGELVAFVAAANILLEAVVGAAGLARSWTSYFASLIGRNPDDLRIHVPSLSDGFQYLDPIAVAVLLSSSTIAILGTKRTSSLNWITSVLSAAIIVFIIAAGLAHAKPRNLTPFFPFGVQGMLRGAAVVYWSYTGFDMIATMAEETKNPGRDIPLGLVGSMTAITVVYCVMSLVLTMMQRYSELDPNAAFSVAFAGVGMRWAQYLVALGALKGMTTGLLVGSLGQARYTTQIARAHMIPPYFALVHPRTGTPVYATLLVTIPAACLALFSSLDVLAEVSSISTLFIFMLIAVALLVRRYYDASGKAQGLKLAACIVMVVAASAGLSGWWGWSAGGWAGYAVVGPMWLAGVLGMVAVVPQQRAPKVWGVPLVPWLPCLSITTNLFLMGSLGRRAYERFGICTVGMLLYYLFFGLHATYDAAHEEELPEEGPKREVNDECGGGDRVGGGGGGREQWGF